MTRHDASDLARIITTHFRNPLHADAYAAALIDYDRGPAEAAIRQLTRTEEHAPSIAKLHMAIRAQFRTDPTEIAGCAGCSGDGLVTVHLATCGIPFDQLDGRTMCLCNRFKPCRCRAGQVMANVYAKHGLGTAPDGAR